MIISKALSQSDSAPAADDIWGDVESWKDKRVHSVSSAT